MDFLKTMPLYSNFFIYYRGLYMFFVFDMEVYICWLQIKSINGLKQKKKKSLYTMASTDKFGVILD